MQPSKEMLLKKIYVSCYIFLYNKFYTVIYFRNKNFSSLFSLYILKKTLVSLERIILDEFYFTNVYIKIHESRFLLNYTIT